MYIECKYINHTDQLSILNVIEVHFLTHPELSGCITTLTVCNTP